MMNKMRPMLIVLVLCLFVFVCNSCTTADDKYCVEVTVLSFDIGEKYPNSYGQYSECSGKMALVAGSQYHRSNSAFCWRFEPENRSFHPPELPDKPGRLRELMPELMSVYEYLQTVSYPGSNPSMENRPVSCSRQSEYCHFDYGVTIFTLGYYVRWSPESWDILNAVALCGYNSNTDQYFFIDTSVTLGRTYPKLDNIWLSYDAKHVFYQKEGKPFRYSIETSTIDPITGGDMVIVAWNAPNLLAYSREDEVLRRLDYYTLQFTDSIEADIEDADDMFAIDSNQFVICQKSFPTFWSSANNDIWYYDFRRGVSRKVVRANGALIVDARVDTLQATIE